MIVESISEIQALREFTSRPALQKILKKFLQTGKIILERNLDMPKIMMSTENVNCMNKYKK